MLHEKGCAAFEAEGNGHSAGEGCAYPVELGGADAVGIEPFKIAEKGDGRVVFERGADAKAVLIADLFTDTDEGGGMRWVIVSSASAGFI